MIIPIFVPHEGCPNDCAFCNQRTISGKSVAPGIKEARHTIEEYLSGGKKAQQIAFFGGSFTGIEEEKQNEYLSLAEEYIKKGLVESIRLSTRPDYIDRETVKRLISYGVKNIELGAQSMDEDVLCLAKRGHSAYDVEKAAEIIGKSEAILGLQMMTGLPGDTPEKCLYTAQRFKELGAEETRIYPTVVLRGTYLEKMLENVVLIEEDVDTDAVTLGVTVSVLDVEFEEELTYKVVGSAEADPMNGLLSDDSPLGMKLAGAKVGDTVVVEAPIGEIRYKVINISK